MVEMHSGAVADTLSCLQAAFVLLEPPRASLLWQKATLFCCQAWLSWQCVSCLKAGVCVSSCSPAGGWCAVPCVPGDPGLRPLCSEGSTAPAAPTGKR